MTWSQVIIGAETPGAVPSDDGHCYRETMVPVCGASVKVIYVEKGNKITESQMQ